MIRNLTMFIRRINKNTLSIGTTSPLNWHAFQRGVPAELYPILPETAPNVSLQVFEDLLWQNILCQVVHYQGRSESKKGSWRQEGRAAAEPVPPAYPAPTRP